VNVKDLDSRAVLTIEETAELLERSRWVVYRAVRAGELPSLRLGRRLLIPTASLRKLLGIDAESSSHRPASLVEGSSTLAVSTLEADK